MHPPPPPPPSPNIVLRSSRPGPYAHLSSRTDSESAVPPVIISDERVMKGPVKLTDTKESTASSKWGDGWGLGKTVQAAMPERKDSITLPTHQPGELERRDTHKSHTSQRSIDSRHNSRSLTPRPRPQATVLDSTSTLVGSVFEGKVQDNVGSGLDGSVNTTQRLADLRAEMDKASVDFYIIPSEDAHGSKCVAASDKRREFITGFTGPSGVAIVSQDHAYLVTDSGYWNQAETQTDKNWQIIRTDNTKNSTTYQDWIAFLLATVSRGQRIGIDARLISHYKASFINSKLGRLGCKFTFPSRNLVDLVWKDKPLQKRGIICVQSIKYIGKGATYKLYQLREWIKAQPPSIPSHSEATESTPQQTHVGMLITSLSCIAWTLNLHGEDIPFKLYFHAYLYVGLDRAILFLDSSKLTESVSRYLESMNVERREYTDLWIFLREREWGEGKLLIPPSASYAISLLLTHFRYILAADRVEHLRQVKNGVEVQGLRDAYIRDGVAFVRFVAWLESKLKSGYKITERQAAQGLEKFRGMEKNFMSFACETVSVSGPNALLPYFVPRGPSAAIIGLDTPYVVGWGTHYKDGTCNTIRAFHFGRPKLETRKGYTQVLKRLIAFENAVFLEGMSGNDLELLVKKTQMDHGHGSNSGPKDVYCPVVNIEEEGLNGAVRLVPGHVITSKTSCSVKDEWGIRIGNTFLVKVRSQFDSNVWLGLERLTCVPIQTRMVEKSMLTTEEKMWLKEHNRRCWDVLSPYLQDDDGVLQWLKREADWKTS